MYATDGNDSFGAGVEANEPLRSSVFDADEDKDAIDGTSRELSMR